MSEQAPAVLFLLPSLRISGGVLETFRLASDLRSRGMDARIVSLWRDRQEVFDMDFPYLDVPIAYLSAVTPRKSRALFELPYLLWSFWGYYRSMLKRSKGKGISVVLTHYSTLLFAVFVSRRHRYCFVQDMEWRFVQGTLLRELLKKFIISVYRRSSVVTTNSWVSRKMQSLGIVPIAEASIWAAAEFSVPSLGERPIDVIMLLRRNHFKRIDLYMRLARLIKQQTQYRCAVIAPDDDMSVDFRSFVEACYVRPSRKDLIQLYQRSKIFLLLSDAEGFGLPPLEAMGAGCIPVCRDSGGVQCYMNGALHGNLVPLSFGIDSVVDHLKLLLCNQAKLEDLSIESRRVFEDGLRLSAEERARGLSLLLDSLGMNRNMPIARAKGAR